MAFSRGNVGRRSRPWRRKARQSRFGFTLLVAAVVGGLAAAGVMETGLGGWLLDEPYSAAPLVPVSSRTFPICGGGTRHTCVVDGDTFWLDGVKIRIADINTPEIGEPRCAHEARLGRLAQQRLGQLLNQGVFDLRAADRDEDQYGRKLRIVERGGRSIGDVLVSEGLAHSWRGFRQSWC